jgi:hypothetical protein
MDLQEALGMWYDMGNRTESKKEDSKFTIFFVNKQDVIEGIVTAIAGEGISWSLPDSLMEYASAKRDAELSAFETQSAE